MEMARGQIKASKIMGKGKKRIKKISIIFQTIKIMVTEIFEEFHTEQENNSIKSPNAIDCLEE